MLYLQYGLSKKDCDFIMKRYSDSLNFDLALLILYHDSLPKNMKMYELGNNPVKVVPSYQEYLTILRNADNDDIKFLKCIISVGDNTWENIPAPKYDIEKHETLVKHLDKSLKSKRDKEENKDLLEKNLFTIDDYHRICKLLGEDYTSNFIFYYYSNLRYYNEYMENKVAYDFCKKIRNMTVADFFNTYLVSVE